jgi:excisionase family DNA binding protein
VTVDEVAAALALSPHTIRVQIRNGRLKAVKRGRDWHITPGEVARYRRDSLGRQGKPPKGQKPSA